VAKETSCFGVDRKFVSLIFYSGQLHT